MLSIPPATEMAWSPVAIPWLASMIAFIPEAQTYVPAAYDHHEAHIISLHFDRAPKVLDRRVYLA